MNRLRIFMFAVWILGLLLLPVGGIEQQQAFAAERVAANSMDVTYEVTPGDPSTVVDIFIKSAPRNLVLSFYEAPVDLRKSIQTITADDGEGQSLRVSFSGHSWQIDTRGAKNVHVRYEISNVISYQGGLPHKKQGNEIAVYISKEGGILDGRYFFLVPIYGAIKTIRVKWNVPLGWKVVCPYEKEGDYFVVPRITQNIRVDFVARQGIYFGLMKYYSEATTASGVKVKFGILSFDEDWEFRSPNAQTAVETYVHQAAQAVERLSKFFGESPYPLFTFYSNFKAEEWVYPGTREIVGGYQYWPEGRYSELIGHLLYSWISFWKGISPVVADPMIAKGLGEEYLGSKIAYEITGDAHYLGQLYSYYLVYARSYGTSYYRKVYAGGREIMIYYKGAMLGLYLDHLIQQETNGKKSLEDVFGYLYRTYKNSGHTVTLVDLQRAVDKVTGVSHADLFRKYVYGDQRIPVEDFLDTYQKAFPTFIEELQRDFFKNYQGYTIPYFVDVEMALSLAYHLPFGILCESYDQQFAEYVRGHYDVNALTEQNVDEALSYLTGQCVSGFFERWQNIYKGVTLKEMKEWLMGKTRPGEQTSFAGAQKRFLCPLADSAKAYLVPDVILAGVPTEVTLHIVDGEWLTDNTVRIGVEAWTDEYFGQMLSGVREHLEAINEGNGSYFEGGYIPLVKRQGEWVGTMMLTLPEAMKRIAIRPNENAYDEEIEFCIQVVYPTPTPTPTGTPVPTSTATFSPSPTLGQQSGYATFTPSPASSEEIASEVHNTSGHLWALFLLAVALFLGGGVVFWWFRVRRK